MRFEEALHGMTDVTAAQTGGFSLPGIGSLGDLAKRGDLALAIGVLTILLIATMLGSRSTWPRRG